MSDNTENNSFLKAAGGEMPAHMRSDSPPPQQTSRGWWNANESPYGSPVVPTGQTWQDNYMYTNSTPIAGGQPISNKYQIPGASPIPNIHNIGPPLTPPPPPPSPPNLMGFSPVEGGCFNVVQGGGGGGTYNNSGPGGSPGGGGTYNGSPGGGVNFIPLPQAEGTFSKGAGKGGETYDAGPGEINEIIPLPPMGGGRSPQGGGGPSYNRSGLDDQGPMNLTDSSYNSGRSQPGGGTSNAGGSQPGGGRGSPQSGGGPSFNRSGLDDQGPMNLTDSSYNSGRGQPGAPGGGTFNNSGGGGQGGGTYNGSQPGGGRGSPQGGGGPSFNDSGLDNQGPMNLTESSYNSGRGQPGGATFNNSGGGQGGGTFNAGGSQPGGGRSPQGGGGPSFNRSGLDDQGPMNLTDSSYNSGRSQPRGGTSNAGGSQPGGGRGSPQSGGGPSFNRSGLDDQGPMNLTDSSYNSGRGQQPGGGTFNNSGGGQGGGTFNSGGGKGSPQGGGGPSFNRSGLDDQGPMDLTDSSYNSGRGQPGAPGGGTFNNSGGGGRGGGTFNAGGNQPGGGTFNAGRSQPGGGTFNAGGGNGSPPGRSPQGGPSRWLDGSGLDDQGPMDLSQLESSMSQIIDPNISVEAGNVNEGTGKIPQAIMDTVRQSINTERDKLKDELMKNILPSTIDNYAKAAVTGLAPHLIVEKVRDNIQEKVKAKLGTSLMPLLADALLKKFGPKLGEVMQSLQNGQFPCARPCTCGPGNSLDDSMDHFVKEMDNYSAKLMSEFKKTMMTELPPLMRKVCTDKVKAAFPKEKILEVMKDTAPHIIRRSLREAVVNEVKNLLPEVLGSRTITEIFPRLARREMPCQRACKCPGNPFTSGAPRGGQQAPVCPPGGGCSDECADFNEMIDKIAPPSRSPKFVPRVARETNTPERFRGAGNGFNNMSPGSFGRDRSVPYSSFESDPANDSVFTHGMGNSVFYPDSWNSGNTPSRGGPGPNTFDGSNPPAGYCMCRRNMQ